MLHKVSLEKSQWSKQSMARLELTSPPTVVTDERYWRFENRTTCGPRPQGSAPFVDPLAARIENN